MEGMDEADREKDKERGGEGIEVGKDGGGKSSERVLYERRLGDGRR